MAAVGMYVGVVVGSLNLESYSLRFTFRLGRPQYVHSVSLTEVREGGDKSLLWWLTPRAGISCFPSLTYCHSSGGFKMGMLVTPKVLRR